MTYIREDTSSITIDFTDFKKIMIMSLATSCNISDGKMNGEKSVKYINSTGSQENTRAVNKSLFDLQ